MFGLRAILIYWLAFVCTFAWLWRVVIESMIGRRGPRPLWPPWEFNSRYVALVLQRVVYCLFGVGFAIVIIFIVLRLITRL
jgi:hypothetical protein